MKLKSIVTLAVLSFLLFAPGIFSDDEAFAEGDDIFELVGRADGDSETVLYGDTAYEFEFEVWANEGAGEAVRKFMLTLPDPEYDLDLDSLVVPTPLAHEGETPGTWQASFDAVSYTITYEYLDAAGAVGAGNIRAGEHLVFSFTATTDPGEASDGERFANPSFHYGLIGDAEPPVIVADWYSFGGPLGDDDDDTGDEIFELVGRADGDSETVLYGDTTYDFEFEVWANEGSGEAIRKFMLTLPCAEYDLDLDTLVAPEALVHAGETPGTWQASFDAVSYTMTYEYLDATGAPGVGNVRAGENLVFSFTATTDQGLDDYGPFIAESVFPYVLVGDGDPPTQVEHAYNFPIPADDDTTGDDDTTADDDDDAGPADDDDDDDDDEGCGC